jgi:hypothetical protein
MISAILVNLCYSQCISTVMRRETAGMIDIEGSPAKRLSGNKEA